MSLFSDLFNQCQLSATVYFNGQACGEWQVKERALGVTCFHMVTLGGCWLDVPHHLECELFEGDVVIFPYELSHTMSPLLPQTLLNGSDDEISSQTCTIEDSNNNLIGLLCGEMHFKKIGTHHSAELILQQLPPVFIIRAEHAKPWLKPLLELIWVENHTIHHTNPPNSLQASATGFMISRLSELLFIKCIEHFVQFFPQDSGVLALYVHPKLHLAIKKIHATPEMNISLLDLAHISGMSRTSFANEFKNVSGWTSKAYVKWWRMRLAWQLLQSGHTISQTCEKVGYASETAFATAFKEQFGVSAGQVKHMS